LKKGICHDTFRGWDFERICGYVAALGYDGIEIAPWTFADSATKINSAERQYIRRAAQRAGLEVIGLHTVTRGPEGIYLNSPDPVVRQRTTAYICELANLCADLGGKVLVFGSAKHRNVLPGLSYSQAWAFFKDTFLPVLDHCAERGVVCCLEPLSPRLTDFVTRAEEALHMVEEIGHPAFRMMLDVRSASDDLAPIPELIRRCAPYLTHFHANDDNGRGPGMGGADYPAISAALFEVGYAGYVSVEVFDFTPDPETIARESMAVLRCYFG
jgi:sugar phosphate isomerase/epimerase